MRRLALLGAAVLLAACGQVPTGSPEVLPKPGGLVSSRGSAAVRAQPDAHAVRPVAGQSRARSEDRLLIPSIGLDARIRSVRFIGARLQIPPSVAEVGRWRDGAGLGDAVGTTVLVGHVSDDRDRPGVMSRLGRLRPGAEIRVRVRGQSHRFRVDRVKDYAKASLPRGLFSQSGPHRLVLITCSHKVSYRGGGFHYAQNLVVTARPG